MVNYVAVQVYTVLQCIYSEMNAIFSKVSLPLISIWYRIFAFDFSYIQYKQRDWRAFRFL